MSRFNIEKLTERVNFISEYNYYNPRPEDLTEAPEDEATSDDQEPEAGDDIEDTEETPTDAQPRDGDDTEDGSGDDAGEDLNADLADEIDFDVEGGGDEAMPTDDMGGEDEVEVDVTEITDGIDQNNQAIDGITQKLDNVATSLSKHIDQIIQNNAKLVSQVNQMEKNMEQQFKKRNPTPNEQLMLRSLSSYPYNQKLTDYWKPADGSEYDYSIENGQAAINQNDRFDVNVKKTNDEDENPKEYVLTDKDIEDDYNEGNIKQSFNYNSMRLR